MNEAVGAGAGSRAIVVSEQTNTTRKNKNYPNKKLLDDIRTKIESLPGSYRFLYTEPKSLDSSYFFVGLNPGGEITDPSDLFVEVDNAIVHEKWDKSGKGYNGLQQQVIYLFQQMANYLGVGEWIPYMSQKWMISNYVFYRSKRWAEMARKKEHIANCKAIWKMIFEKNTPKVIIANGHEAYEFMIEMLEEFEYTKESEAKSCRAWDGPHITIMKKEETKCLLVGFAHLSTFKVVKREENRACMENVYKMIKTYQ